MNITPKDIRGLQLFQEGTVALSEVEQSGIRIDTGYLDATRKELKTQIKEDEKELFSSKEWKVWLRRFGQNANIYSNQQLGTIVYKELGMEVKKRTEKGTPSTDEEAFEGYDSPFITKLIRCKKRNKALTTYLDNIRREVSSDGFLHPVFNLNTVITYRSSSENPNFQNMPIRDPEMGKMIRRAFIPRPGCLLLENDFKGLEVCVSACYNKDPNLISYIKDPTKDMHRDMAAQLYMLKAKQVSKKARYGAKNKYVFPEFYGSFWAQCAPALWEWIDLGQLMVEGSDVSIRDHLASKGITELGDCSIDEENGIASPQPGTFAHHVMQVEKDFWGNRFKVYAQWKRNWYDEFLRKGYFDTYTGFRLSGEFKRNEAVNYPIQGSGFHCLLWTLIHTLKAKRKAKMRSLVVGQIHDSMLSDIPVDELDDFSAMVNELVSVDLPRVWDWIIVPMQIETEICAPGCTWYDKKEVHYKDGSFSLDDKQHTSQQLLKLLQQKVKAST